MKHIKQYMKTNKYKSGGNLSKFNSFNEGGSHENNPNGGIPMGQGDNGKLNTVEEGESSFDFEEGKYIFSNRLNYTYDDSLPKSTKNSKTFADASKIIMKQFEERTDNASRQTMDELMGRLRDAQDFVKSQIESEDSSQEVLLEDDAQDLPIVSSNVNPIAENDNEFALGGLFNKLGGKGGLASMFGGKGAAGGNPLGGALGMAGDVASNLMTNKDGSQDAGGAAIGGALSGASKGMALGPIGAIGGALIGGVSGLINGKSAERERNKLNREGAALHNNTVLNTFDDGGRLNPINTKSLHNNNLLNPLTGNYYDRPTAKSFNIDGLNRPGLEQSDSSKLRLKQSGFDTSGLNRPSSSESINNIGKLDDGLATAKPIGHQEPSKLSSVFNAAKFTVEDGLNGMGKGLGKAGKFIGENKNDILRHAPTVMDALQLNNMEKPQATRLNKLDARYKPEYTDEQRLQNMARENFNTTAEGLGSASGGSTSALRSNILGAQVNRAKALSNAYSKASDSNKSENRAAQQFNIGVDKVNLGQSNLEEDITAKDLGVYNTNKSKMLTSLANNLGAAGKEGKYKDIVEKLYGYNQKGDYLNKKKGKAKAVKLKGRGPKLANTPFNPMDFKLNI